MTTVGELLFGHQCPTNYNIGLLLQSTVSVDGVGMLPQPEGRCMEDALAMSMGEEFIQLCLMPWKSQVLKTGTSRPTDGAACSDWTFFADECHFHVDCPSLPDCLNILGTYCGWCKDTNTALKVHLSFNETNQ